MLNFSENLVKLRHGRKITQEQLADFVGVTKASVSKWETGQSIPDVGLLPQLATFFDVSIDELLGYKPQLAKEQIQKIYLELSGDFATEEFEYVMQKSKILVKQYYSCYEFLKEIVNLWLNHYMLPEGARSVEILQEAEELCEHILGNCKDIGICNDVVLLKASASFLQGKGMEVVDALEELENPCRLATQGEGILIGAYLQLGDVEKANSFTQIAMYNHLMSLVGCATQYILIHQDNLVLCEETRKRVESVEKAYKLEKLNFNVMALFYYQMAIVYSIHDKKSEAIRQLQRFVELTDNFLCHDEKHLHTDDYFDGVDVWFEKLILGGNAPRDKKIIYNSMVGTFETPVFACLQNEKEFLELKTFVQKRGDTL